MLGGPRASLTVVGLNHDVHAQCISYSLDGQCPLYEGTRAQEACVESAGERGPQGGSEAGRAHTVAVAGMASAGGSAVQCWGRGGLP